MRVYLAAAYGRQSEMQGVRDVLEATGHEITSSWIDKTSEPPGGLGASHLAENPLAGVEHARTDLADLDAAEAVISFTGGGGRGGRHIEFGHALACGKYLIVVGPREHIFHSLAAEWYPDFAHLMLACSGAHPRSGLLNDLPPAAENPESALSVAADVMGVHPWPSRAEPDI